jgi:hypothetical protein
VEEMMKEVKDLMESYETKMNEIKDDKNEEEVFKSSFIIHTIFFLFYYSF